MGQWQGSDRCAAQEAYLSCDDVPPDRDAYSSASTGSRTELFNYKLVVAYDGTRFSGFQLQRGNPNALTIQGKLEEVLSRVTSEDRRVLRLQAAGRTDAGVHAAGQVVQLNARRAQDPAGVQRALNAMLPKDIRVLSVAAAQLEWNVRYADSKTYHYTIHTAPVADPFNWHYRHHPRWPERLDVGAMRAAAALFGGRHSFSEFCSTSPDGARKNPVKLITRCELVDVEGGVRLEVQGSGFLYRQVRHMAGALLAVGAGRLAPARIQALLASGSADARPAQGHAARGWDAAEAKGLSLHAVEYGGLAAEEL